MSGKIGGPKSPKFGGDINKLKRMAKLVSMELPENPTDVEALGVIMKIAELFEKIESCKKVGN